METYEYRLVDLLLYIFGIDDNCSLDITHIVNHRILLQLLRTHLTNAWSTIDGLNDRYVKMANCQLRKMITERFTASNQ